MIGCFDEEGKFGFFGSPDPSPLLDHERFIERLKKIPEERRLKMAVASYRSFLTWMARLAAHLTEEELGLRIGVKPEGIVAIETGTWCCSDDDWKRIVCAFGPWTNIFNTFSIESALYTERMRLGLIERGLLKGDKA